MADNNQKPKYILKFDENSSGFTVVCFEGEEALGRPHRFELTLMSNYLGVDTKNFINKSACLLLHADTIDNAEKLDRHTRYVGVIVEMEKLHSFGETNFYRAVFVSEIWKLSLFNASCFYKTKDKNVIDLIEFIFNLNYESGDKYLVQTDLETSKLSGNNNDNYQTRDFFLQYNESRLHFLQRWMEKEGLYYTITGLDGFKEKLTLYSDVSQLLLWGRQRVTVTYRPIATANTSDVDDSIYKFAQNSKILPKYIKLRDYNYNQASVELTVTHKVSDRGFGELDIFGENYRNLTEGERYAKNYAEALQCDAFSYHGSGSATGITAGCFIDFLDTEYLVTKVKHTGSQAAAFLGADVCTPLGFKVKDGYQCDFEVLAINSSDPNSEQQQFRMQRITPKPVVAGNLNALIHKTGYNDKEGYASVEEDGEYSVKFKSIDVVDITSAESKSNEIKMRLSTPYAGFDHGMHFPLPQGTEVLVGFTNGDPDLPVIMGAVNNSLSPSLSTADNNTDNIIKTPSGNRITLSDHKERRGITLAVPSVENGTHYDAVQTISPGEDPKISSWVDTIRGDKYSNFLGSSFSLSAGTSSSISASLSSSVSLASSVSMSAGISNTINLGSMGVSWSPKIPKIHDLVTHTSLSLGDGGQSVSYGNDSQVIETHKSFEIKTGAIDHSLDAKVLESNEVFLKRAIAASLAFDIAASFALQQAPEIAKAVKVGRIEKNYKKAIDDANLKYKESISKAEQITEEQDRLKKKRQAINVLEEDKDAAANIRSEELKDLEKNFFVDNGWGMRLISNGVRTAIQVASNLAILEGLKRHGNKLAKHKENIGAYKNKLLMDNNGFCVRQNLMPGEDNGFLMGGLISKSADNNLALNLDGFNVKHKVGNIEQNINISSKDGNRIISIDNSINQKVDISSTKGNETISIDNSDNQKIKMSMKDKLLTIKNGNYLIKLQEHGIYLGFISDKNNPSQHPEKYIAITKNGIFSTGELDLSQGAVKAKSSGVKIANGIITITSN